MEAKLKQMENLSRIIASELKQIKTRRENRYKAHMKHIEKIRLHIASDLKQIEKRQQEREDKICGVCYDCEATCKLDCVHKLCEHCYWKMESCPFCRKSYKYKDYYLDILLDKEIDINAKRDAIMMQTKTLGHDLNRFESILDDTYELSKLLELCSEINRLVGKPIFYRERFKDRYLYQKRLASDMSIRVAVWETFLRTRVSKIKQEQFIDRLNRISNRIYNKLPICVGSIM